MVPVSEAEAVSPVCCPARIRHISDDCSHIGRHLVVPDISHVPGSARHMVPGLVFCVLYGVEAADPGALR